MKAQGNALGIGLKRWLSPVGARQVVLLDRKARCKRRSRRQNDRLHAVPYQMRSPKMTKPPELTCERPIAHSAHRNNRMNKVSSLSFYEANRVSIDEVETALLCIQDLINTLSESANDSTIDCTSAAVLGDQRQNAAKR